MMYPTSPFPVVSPVQQGITADTPPMLKVICFPHNSGVLVGFVAPLLTRVSAVLILFVVCSVPKRVQSLFVWRGRGDG